MATLLDGLLPRLYPWLEFQCVPHSGKKDLRKSVPRKLRGWREPGVRFVVMQDQDRADCHQVKRELRQACDAGGRDDVLIRVVCRELEAWYIGEAQAAASAYPEQANALQRELGKARYRNPDTVVNPAGAFQTLVPQFQKRTGARRMAQVLSTNNRSRSFQVLLAGIDQLRPTLEQ